MADWYYADGDVQRGPVSREKLVQLIAGGQVAAADLVWTDTMSDWVPAGQVPGLITAGGGGARGRVRRRAGAEDRLGRPARGHPGQSSWFAAAAGCW